MAAPLKNEVSGVGQTAIVGISKKHHGVAGESKEAGAGVLGISNRGDGVSGTSKTGYGSVGQSERSSGIRGLSKSGHGVEGLSETAEGVLGVTDSGNGVSGNSKTGFGAVGQSERSSGVRGVSKSGRGVEGWSETAYGVSGDSAKSAGVRGTSVDGRGVEGWSSRSEGVFGTCELGTGVYGVAGRSRLSELGLGPKYWGSSSAYLVDQAARSRMTSPSDSAPHGHDLMEMQHTSIASLESETFSDDAEAIHETAATTTAVSDYIDTDLAGGGVSYSVIDDSAGVGVFGEHRRAGIGVKAVSDKGMGLAAYSTGHEAIHAETRSPETAAIAAYNLNHNSKGAAIFAKKDGMQGHAGFFHGNVWISGELAVGGDILLANADCAEDFDVADMALAEPGTVMVVGDEGVLRPSAHAYDKRVAGVVSGAGEYKPGMILDKQKSQGNRRPIALLGKVYCKATAEQGAIEVGDLLTTSHLPGHAMKAIEPAQAFGAVIGKALRPLKKGQGLIPILIALQ